MNDVDHLYTVAVCGCKEVHDKMKSVMDFIGPVFSDLKHQGVVDHLGVHHRVFVSMCADWKLLYVMRGFPRPSSVGEFCLFCKATRDDRGNHERLWCIDPDRASSLSRTRPVDLFAFVDLFDTIPDCLHAMLRITDRLTQLTFGMFSFFFVVCCN